MHWFTINEILFCFFNIISDFGSIAVHDEIIWAIGNPKKNQIDAVDLLIFGTQEILNGLVVYFLSKSIRQQQKTPYRSTGMGRKICILSGWFQAKIFIPRTAGKLNLF